MLLSLYENESYDPYINKCSTLDNLYVVKSFETDFKEIFDELTQIDMYEGLVLKRKDAKLELGLGEKNNTKTQIKFRKEAKNYQY
jgi:hypothetical protein